MYRLSLSSEPHEAERLFSAGRATYADPFGRYVGVQADDGVAIFSLRLRRAVATIKAADFLTFAPGDRALASVRTTAPKSENDCQRSTILVEVDLGTGEQTPRFTSETGLTPFAWDDEGAIATEVLSGCDESRVVAIDWATAATRALVPRGSVVAAHPSGQRVLVQVPRDAMHPHGQLAVLNRAGTVTETLPYHVDSADVSPAGAVVFDQPAFDANGFATSNTVHVARGDALSRSSHRALRNDGALHWGPDGAGFVLRQPVGDGLVERAAYCSATTFRCRPLPLTWTTEVDLIAVVPARAFGP